MSRLSLSLLVMAAGALAVCAYLAQAAMTDLRTRNGEQARLIGELKAANAGLAEGLAHIAVVRNADNLAVLQAAQEAERLAQEARSLELQLQEAMRDDRTFSFDDPLPRGAAHALCLRWRAAGGHVSVTADYQGKPAAGADARTDDPAAPDCTAWEGVSMRDVVEWAGVLLDHAGAERLDKAALRAWMKDVQGEEAMGPE